MLRIQRSCAGKAREFAVDPLQNSFSVGEAMPVRSVMTAEEARAGASSQGRMHMRSKRRGTAQSPAIRVKWVVSGVKRFAEAPPRVLPLASSEKSRPKLLPSKLENLTECWGRR